MEEKEDIPMRIAKRRPGAVPAPVDLFLNTTCRGWMGMDYEDRKTRGFALTQPQMDAIQRAIGEGGDIMIVATCQIDHWCHEGKPGTYALVASPRPGENPWCVRYLAFRAPGVRKWSVEVVPAAMDGEITCVMTVPPWNNTWGILVYFPSAPIADDGI